MTPDRHGRPHIGHDDDTGPIRNVGAYGATETSLPSSHTRRARVPRGRYWRRRIVVTTLALGLVAAVVTAGSYGYLQWRFHQLHRENVAGLTSAGSQAPFNVLLVGDNCRDCLDGSQAAAFGSAAEVGGGRSDVTMLLHVDPATNRVAILSIPRDLWLPIPDSANEIRVDAALNNGPSALVTTIEDDLGIPINHYVELNFDTFQKVVNALGGVNINFPTRMYDSYSGLNVPTGCFHLNGTQALQVVRARHTYYQQNGAWQYDGLGDISRIQRDHEFLKILASAVTARGLGNPVVDNNLISSVVKDITIDSSFTLSSLGQLAQTFSHVNLGDAPQTTLPVDEDNSPDGFVYKGSQYGDVVFPSNAADRAAIASFLGQSAARTGPVPAKLPVTVVNGSGIAGQATAVATGLHALGFQIADTTSGNVDSSPAETVVYYAPGHQPQAEQLAGELGGAVAIGENQSLAGAGLTLVTGTNLTVASPPAPASHPSAPSTTPPPAAQPTQHPTAAPPAAAPSATPLGGLTQLNPSYPAFDPTACAPTAQPGTLPTLPTPSSAELPSM